MDLAILVGGTLAALLVVTLIDLVAGRPDRAQPTRPKPGREPEGGGGLREGLRSTRALLAGRLAEAFGRDGTSLFDRLEEALIGADVGVATSQALVEGVRSEVGAGAGEETVRAALRRRMLAAFRSAPRPEVPSAGPRVVLVTGVNGVGKTTTIGKLAARHRDAGHKVLLVAGDTFRAAAADQLEAWGERVGVSVVRHQAGGSPAAVVYDGMAAAVARGVDVVLVDTAGRLHTRKPLVEELRKVRRVIAEAVPGAPHETLLVLDATTGQNALSQARTFLEAIEITGVVLTKLDGTARGGVTLAVAHDLGLPITDVGVGEREADLRPFDAEEFVDALLGPAAQGTVSPSGAELQP
jgi:fused signal recognition particle receptor